MARVMHVIETFDRRGRGTQDDPVRMVRQFWSLEGDLLMEHDPSSDVDREELARFRKHYGAWPVDEGERHRAWVEAQRCGPA